MIFDLPPKDPGLWLPPKPAIIRPASDLLVPRRHPLLAHRLRRVSGGGVSPLTFVTSATSISSSITIPASAQAGDLAILADYGYTAGSSVSIQSPSGWTQWSGSSASNSVGGGADQCGACMSYKILESGDPSSSASGINADSESKVMFIFRGSVPITALAASTADSQATGSNPGSQSIAASGQAVPLVAIGVAACNISTAAFSTESPAFDATVRPSNNDLILGYKIYNSSPANHTIDMNDLGTNNYLASGYISVS